MSEYEILQGDVREVLRGLPDGIVQTCVTSPPYFGLRSYLPGDHADKVKEVGHGQSLEQYVQSMVEVFREVRRVLRDDGTLWLNLGDSYAANRPYQVPSTKGGAKHGPAQGVNGAGSRVPDGLKPKDLIGIPWRVAFALQADGWFLRAACPWVKRNPMPESVTDRPGTSHEYVFLLAKSADYFYDRHGVLVAFADARQGRDGGKKKSQRNRGGRDDGFTTPSGIDPPANGGRNRRSGDWFFDAMGMIVDEVGDPVAFTPTVKPYKKAHFATFPEGLVEPCVLVGSSQQACSVCGAPFDRVIESREAADSGAATGNREVRNDGGTRERAPAGSGGGNVLATVNVGTSKFHPACSCDAESARQLVLDPFAGSGTTGVVALRHGRDFVGIELNAEYVTLAHERIQASLLKETP